MKRILYIFLGVLTLTACQPELSEGECVLELDIVRANVPIVHTRGVDADLAISIRDANGQERAYYLAGNIPNIITLNSGTFTICAYTENQTTWHTANNGKGEACYFAEQSVTMEYDQKTYITMEVPMTNLAIGIEFPELFDDLFSSYQFNLKSGNREVAIQEGEKAYFSVTDEGFSYALSATNIDGVSHTQPAKQITNVESGKCYLLQYQYSTETASYIDTIEITHD